jgi:hypothetical protein
MRKTLLSLLLVASGAIGLAGSTAIQAQDRVYVRSGDVVFSYGRPYWRHDPGIPLRVVYDRGYPRYYHYRGPGYRPGHLRYHEPRWRDRHWRSARWYGPRYYDHDRRYRYRDYDRGVVIEYRDWD